MQVLELGGCRVYSKMVLASRDIVILKLIERWSWFFCGEAFMF